MADQERYPDWRVECFCAARDKTAGGAGGSRDPSSQGLYVYRRRESWRPG